jgi:hypothetical protein
VVNSRNTGQCIYSDKPGNSDGFPWPLQSWYHREPHASSPCFQNSISQIPPLWSLHPIYAPVDPDGTAGYLPYFYLSDRFRQYSLVTIARSAQRDRQRSHFATTSQEQRIMQRFVSVKRGHRTRRSACTCEAESARLVFFPAVRFQLAARVTKGYNLKQLQSVDILS